MPWRGVVRLRNSELKLHSRRVCFFFLESLLAVFTLQVSCCLISVKSIVTLVPGVVYIFPTRFECILHLLHSFRVFFTSSPPVSSVFYLFVMSTELGSFTFDVSHQEMSRIMVELENFYSTQPGDSDHFTLVSSVFFHILHSF